MRTMDERIERLRDWLEATCDGATTELDRDIIAVLFGRMNAGQAAAVRADLESKRATNAEREARDARFVAWAIVMACGGEVEVPSEILMTNPADAVMSRDLDQFKSCYVFKAREG